MLRPQLPPIRRVLAGRHLVVTGITGFVGKVWLAHLLTHVPEIGKVTVLVRGSRREPALRRMARLVDTSPAFDEHVLQAFDETDELLLVTTLDVPTLKNVKIASETLDLLNFPKSRRHLVLNRADDKVGLSTDKVEATLDMKIVQTIPTSAEVPNATNSGEPITASLPKHPVSQALMHLADSVSRAHADKPAL